MNTKIDVNPLLLKWAIDRAGLQNEDLIHKFPKLEDWLNHIQSPTFKQLQDFSKKVHIPFAYLFLDSPPKESIPFPFFRTINPSKKGVSVNLYDTILTLQRRQEWVTEYLQEIGETPLEFVGSFDVTHSYLDIVKAIRSSLGIDENWALSFGRFEEAINYITIRIEELGVIMTFNGVVDNNTSRPITVKECRGFVMVNEYAPFMFINNSDGKAAQMFTIIHELAHIWIGQSAGFDFRALLPANDPMEILCDKVAAEFLVPQNLFLKMWKQTPSISDLSQRFKVSKIVIARRALDLNKITRLQFFRFYNEYREQIKAKRDNQPGGGDFYATAKKRISLRFAGIVNRAVNENKLPFREAYKLTGLKGDTYQNFMSKKLY